MATGDFSQFRQRYRDPIEDEAATRGYEAGRGAKASEMDQYYASLNEQTRQFDIATEAAESQFARSLAFEGEKLASTEELFSQELAFKGKQLAEQAREADQTVALGREQLASETARWQDELEQLRIWQSRQLEESAADRSSRENMFNQELTFNQEMQQKNLALEVKKFNLIAANEAPIVRVGTGKYGQVIYGRKPSSYQFTDSSLGVSSTKMYELAAGMGTVTSSKRAQDSSYTQELSLFDKYLKASGG